jgi:nitrate/nitrite transport system substrate-binding protein
VAKKGKQTTIKPFTRRNFLKLSGMSSLGLLFSNLPARWVGGVYAADGPETPNIRIGIIALTDNSSIVMAHELGLFKKYGIESTISVTGSPWEKTRRLICFSECPSPQPWGY